MQSSLQSPSGGEHDGSWVSVFGGASDSKQQDRCLPKFLILPPPPPRVQQQKPQSHRRHNIEMRRCVVG